MRVAPLPCVLSLALLLSSGASPAAAGGHCQPVTVTPVASDPGAFLIQTPSRSTVARRPAAPAAHAATAAVLEIAVRPGWFDADGDTIGTPHDTVVVTPGTIVRWVRAGPGFHTVTSGRDSGDPTAESEYNAVFDDLTTSFEHTFTTPGLHDFFCYIHEPNMMGSVLVTDPNTGVGETGPFRRATFSRSPSPNPSTSGAAFAIALPRSVVVRLDVLDVAGRTVASVHDGPLTAGEHAFRWNGRDREGRIVPSGRYFVRLLAGDVRESRPVTLAR
jgi:plastocyanin